MSNFYGLDGGIALLFGIQDHPGYLTPFCKNQAEGAWVNGSSVVKDGNDSGRDVTPDGIKGKILGSLKAAGGYAYFVEWDNKPKMPTLCVEEKMKLLE